MKLKTILQTAATIVLCSTTSSAAMLMTFTEEGNNVVMRTTGSVDLSLATWSGDGTVGVSPQSFTYGSGIDYYQGGSTVREQFSGVDLMATNLFSVNESYQFSGNYTIFSIFGNIVRLGTTPNYLDDNQSDTGVFSPDVELTWLNRSFADLGLDVHTQNTDIGLWAGSAVAGDAGTINFRVVPEPSSTALLGLGGLALILRRKRTS